AAVLASLRPRCAVEIGTSRGGSLSMIRQYSDLVFSIDIDRAAADSFRHFSNVSFLTGPSTQILPVLFRELDGAAIPVGFILVDGDHSEAGVAPDIACILHLVSKGPPFVILHGCFHPPCPGWMLAAPSRHVPYP